MNNKKLYSYILTLLAISVTSTNAFAEKTRVDQIDESSVLDTSSSTLEHKSHCKPKKQKCSSCPTCKTTGPVQARAELVVQLPLATQQGSNYAITVIRTARFPGDKHESLIISEQFGRVWKFNLTTNELSLILDISTLTSANVNTEMGLTGLEPDPCFSSNGILYITYSQVNSAGQLPQFLTPNPCTPASLNQTWSYQTQWDHTNVIQEWKYKPGSTYGDFEPVRKFLEIKSVGRNHQGIDNLRWSKEKGGLIYVLGDTSPFTFPQNSNDPYNLCQNVEFIQGKHILLDVKNWPNVTPSPIAKFSELPASVQDKVELLNLGFRNGNAPVSEKCGKRWIKYNAMQGNSVLESIFGYEQFGNNFGWHVLEGGSVPTLETYPFCPNNAPVVAAVFIDQLRNSTLWNDVYRPVESQLYSTQTPWARAQIGALPYKGKITPLKNAVLTAWFRTRAGNTSLPGRLRYFCPDRNCLQQRVNSYDVELAGLDPQVDHRFTAIGANCKFTDFYFGTLVLEFPTPGITNGLLSVYKLQPLN